MLALISGNRRRRRWRQSPSPSAGSSALPKLPRPGVRGRGYSGTPEVPTEVLVLVVALTGSLSSSVRLRFSAIKRQRLRHPAQDLHAPSGQRSRTDARVQLFIGWGRPLTSSSSTGQREESELEAAHGGAHLVFGQWPLPVGEDQSLVVISDPPRGLKGDTGVPRWSGSVDPSVDATREGVSDLHPQPLG